MNNNNDSLGITVISTIPEAHQTSVAVDSSIQIEFSGDLDRSSLNNCIIVFEDYKNVYNGISSLKNTAQFNIIKGKVSYDNRKLMFTPKYPLRIDTRYIVVLSDKVQDITGSRMLKKYIFAFNTELIKSFEPCTILEPKFGTIHNHIPEVEWKEIGAPSYILQISKSPDFEIILHENFIVPNKDNTYTRKEEIEIQPEEIQDEPEIFNTIVYTPDFIFKEGVYYIRIKAEGGKWSEIHQFFMKEVTDAVVAYEDQSDEMYLSEFLADLEEEIEILEFFPADNSINNSLKTNIFYIKIKGKLDESRIDFSSLEVTGEPFDEEFDQKNEHGLVNGSWTLVYDEKYDCTYFIFTPSTEEDNTRTIKAINNQNVNAIE